MEIVATFSKLPKYSRSSRIWHSKELGDLFNRVPRPGEVLSGAKVHGDQQPLYLRAMVDLDPLEGLELTFSLRNLVWLRGQDLKVGYHLLETGRHIWT